MMFSFFPPQDGCRALTGTAALIGRGLLRFVQLDVNHWRRTLRNLWEHEDLKRKSLHYQFSTTRWCCFLHLAFNQQFSLNMFFNESTIITITIITTKNDQKTVHKLKARKISVSDWRLSFLENNENVYFHCHKCQKLQTFSFILILF